VDAAERLIKDGDHVDHEAVNAIRTPPSTRCVVRLRSNSHSTKTFRTAPIRTTVQIIGGMLVAPAWMRVRRRSTNSPNVRRASWCRMSSPAWRSGLKARPAIQVAD